MIKNSKIKNEKLEFIQKNYGWIIALITGIGIIISAIFSFIEYIIASIYFNYYGLDINEYVFKDKGFIYGLVLSLIFMFALFSVLYCIKQTKEYFKNVKANYKNILINITIIILANFYIMISWQLEFAIKDFFVNGIILIIVETFGLLMFFYKMKKDKKISEIKEDLINYFKILPFIIILLIFLISLETILKLKINNFYRIIDDNKAIVYSNSEYYLTLQCEIEEDNIIIYKGNQTKLMSNNIKSEIKKFNIVEIK